MSIDLLQLSAKHLLDKIGAGNHKPGSGSAAALNGILSCKLLMTVIELTIDPTKPKRVKMYSHCKAELEEIRNKITNEISPRLEILFQDDSNQFDKAIQKRKERDKEKNQKVKNDIESESLIELEKSTEIPLEIAQLCIRLAKYSIIVFDKGFKSARGDSSVALGSSLSGLTGCISIISLNLQSFPQSEWTDSIQTQKREIKREYDILIMENSRLMNILDEESYQKSKFLAEFVEIRKSLYGKSKVTHAEIETLARQIQNALYEYRDLIWVSNPPTSMLDLLQPEKVISLLKYAFHKVDTLGVNEQNEEIGGIINNQDFTIRVSSMYPSDVVNFTTAHELGHALLHNKLELHRDLPLDGSGTEKVKPIEEVQADKFAAVFLMPKKIVTQLFNELFQMDRFMINEETAPLLTNRSLYEFRKNIKTKRELSRIIANCKYYNFKRFDSLSKIFQVSTEAMAIRLEELDLIEF